jgi:hypothetical protein
MFDLLLQQTRTHMLAETPWKHPIATPPDWADPRPVLNHAFMLCCRPSCTCLTTPPPPRTFAHAC